MWAERREERLQRAPAASEHASGASLAGELSYQPCGTGDDGHPSGCAPDRHVGPAVADVVEPTLAKPLDQRGGLLVARQISAPIARDHLLEDLEMIGDRPRVGFVGCGGQHERHALLV